MLSGKRFRLKSATLALDGMSASRESLTIPAGSVISIIDGPQPDNPLLRVVWQNRWLLMYEQDIRERAEEIGD